jgi:hypothetical protein
VKSLGHKTTVDSWLNPGSIVSLISLCPSGLVVVFYCCQNSTESLIKRRHVKVCHGPRSRQVRTLINNSDSDLDQRSCFSCCISVVLLVCHVPLVYDTVYHIFITFLSVIPSPVLLFLHDLMRRQINNDNIQSTQEWERKLAGKQLRRWPKPTSEAQK